MGSACIVASPWPWSKIILEVCSNKAPVVVIAASAVDWVRSVAGLKISVSLIESA